MKNATNATEIGEIKNQSGKMIGELIGVKTSINEIKMFMVLMIDPMLAQFNR